MKRDPRLVGLSSEHHQALVLARRLAAATAWTLEHGVELGARFDRQLAPHFELEEALLLPALRDAGAAALSDATLADHRAMRELAARAREGDGEAARELGARLTAHVRFEERELFPTCERLLPEHVLAEVARRSARAGADSV